MMRALIKKWGLTAAVVAISSIVIIALLVFVNINTKKTVEKFVHSHINEINHTAVITLNYNFASFIDLLEQQAKLFEMMESPTDSEIMSALEDFAREDRFKNTAIITYDGRVYSSFRGITEVKPDDKLPNLKKDGIVISQPRVFWDNNLVIDISTPVVIDGEQVGKLVVSISGDGIARMFNNSILQGEADLCLVTGDGTVITRISENDSHFEDDENIFRFFSGEDVRFTLGSPQELTDDFAAKNANSISYEYLGEPFCAFYEPFGINDWYIVTAATNNSLNKGISYLGRLTSILTLGILTVVVASGIVVFMQRKKEQERLAVLKNTYSIAIRKTNDLFYETDMDNDLFIDYSEHGEKGIWKDPPKSYSNALTQVADICAPEYRQEFLDTLLPQNIKIKMKEGISSINFEYKVNIDEGKVRWLAATFVPVVDSINHTTKLICMENDITEQKLKQESLNRRAIMDDLTGLYNKATTMQYTDNFLANEGVSGKHALVIIDIDYFKAVNDKLGHVKGDEVISEFGKGLRRIFRKNDIVGRIGGDEFIVVLKDYGTIKLIEDKADEVLDVFRIVHHHAENKNIKVKTTASIGIALYDKDGWDFNELYKNADAALYIAKDKGRDQYTFF